MDEAELGHPLHKEYAIGHLAEAESECVKSFPDLANAIRTARIAYANDAGPVDVEGLLMRAF